MESSRLAGDVHVDTTGHFRISGVPAGTRTFEARALGVAATTFSVDFKTGARVDTAITLDRVAQNLEEVAVVGTKPAHVDQSGFDERKALGIGHFLTDSDIAKRPSNEIGSILTRVPSLHLNVGRGGWAILMRGGGMNGPAAVSNLCVPSFFLDGQQVSLQDLRTFVQTPDIKGIEVYTAAERIPAQFDRSSKTACGSVVVWSK